MMRIGHGFDVHAFEPGEFLMLGGVRVPYERAFRAHSDGDVLLHALTDALLGAAAMGDIGQHFPDTDRAYCGADSRQLLKQAYQLVLQKGFRLVNADATIIAQAPKMAPHIPSMRTNIAEDLEVDIAAISVKATTTEKMGFTGRGEGIAVHATVLVQSPS